MQEVLAIALASMHQDMTRLDHTAFNLANVATPGYKREVVSIRPFSDVVEQIGMITDAAAATTDSASNPAGLQIFLDSRPGTLKATGEPFDVAITGDGFFEVLTDNGSAYTRQGNFHVDARGRLITAQGYPVMGKNGDIYLTTLTPVIDAAGNITEPNATTGPSVGVPGIPVAQIKIVRFDNTKRMQRIGDGLMAPGGNMTIATDADVQIRQGSLENANVSSAQEMVQLMQTMRHFESMQKIAQGYDEMLGAAIHRLGDLS